MSEDRSASGQGGDVASSGAADQSESPIVRILRAPFFVCALLLSMVPVFYLFASVSMGAWVEEGLQRLGLQMPPRWLPAVLGVLAYTGLGVAAPAVLGGNLLGWPGAVLGPLLALGVIAVLGRW